MASNAKRVYTSYEAFLKKKKKNLVLSKVSCVSMHYDNFNKTAALKQSLTM